MGCKKGCGQSTANLELIVKDIIRGMIDDGLLQEGLVDCTNNRIFRNTRVITCDLLRDALCQLLETGDVCITMPDALAIDDDGHVILTMTDGSKLQTHSTLPDTKLTDVTLKGTVLSFTLSDGNTLPNVDLAGILPDVGLDVTQDASGNITLTKSGQPPVVIPTPPVFGDSIAPVNGKLEVAHDNTIIKLPDGRLSVRDKACVEVNNLTELEGTALGKLGMTCFYKSISTGKGSEQLVIGMPTDPTSEEPTIPALRTASDLSNGFRAYDTARAGTTDISGWQVASATEVSQVLIVDGHAWARTNRGGMSDTGRLANNSLWSDWRKLDNVPTPPAQNTARDIVFKNSTGKITLGYGYSTEQ